MKKCAAPDCPAPAVVKGYCHVHWSRMKRNGTLELKMRPDGTGSIHRGYLIVTVDGEPKRFHVMVAEKTIGKPIPKGAVVHHMDGNSLNNSKDNLLICSPRYHFLLHARMRAMAGCGNPNWRKCVYCKQYDSMENLAMKPSARHPACASKYQILRQRRARETAVLVNPPPKRVYKRKEAK